MCDETKTTSSKDQISFFLNKSMLPAPILSDKMEAEDFINLFIGTPNQQCSVMYAAALQKEYQLAFDGDIEGRLNTIVDTFETFIDKGLGDMLLKLEISHYMKKNAALLKKVMSMSI